MSKDTAMWAMIFGTALLLTYFGFSTTSPDIRLSAASKKLSATGIENLELEALKALDPVAKAELEAVKRNLANAKGDSQRAAEAYKTLSAFWFMRTEAALAGAYARKAAELINTDTAWSIAGTTFMYGLDEGQPAAKRQFCFDGAVQALESAVSLNPNNAEYALNLAMAYVKMPGDQPMKGVMMLRDLEARFPEYEPVQLQLAVLAMETGQLEKSLQRLEKLLSKNPKHPKANCLMAHILEKMNRAEEAPKYSVNCK